MERPTSAMPVSRSPAQDAAVTASTITYGADIPVDIEQAFAFVADPSTWPSFFPCIETAAAGQDWGRVGGRGRMTTRFLGRKVVSDMELTQWDPPHAFRYTARQRGRPELDNQRVFTTAARGTRLVGTTTVQLRRGLPGLFDRISVAVLARVYDRAMAQLADRIPHRVTGTLTAPSRGMVHQ